MHSCQVITISQQKGGSGKTTVATHIAVALSQMGYRTAAIDIDPQGSLTRWYDIRKEKYGEDFAGIHFVPKSGWRVQSEIAALKHKYDYIIIDSPPHNETDAKTAMRSSDMVIIPMQPSPADLWATEKTVLFCKENSIKFAILLNRALHNSKLLDVVTKDLDNLLDTRLGNRVAFSATLMDGKCITEVAPKSQAAEEVKSLVREILKTLGHKNLNKKAV